MKFTSHKSTNMILGAGGIPGVDDLPATMIVGEDGSVTVSSFWVPDTAELKALNEGGGVCLTLYGSMHPPVSIGVVPVEGFRRDG